MSRSARRSATRLVSERGAAPRRNQAPMAGAGLAPAPGAREPTGWARLADLARPGRPRGALRGASPRRAPRRRRRSNDRSCCKLLEPKNEERKRRAEEEEKKYIRIRGECGESRRDNRSFAIAPLNILKSYLKRGVAVAIVLPAPEVATAAMDRSPCCHR